MVKEKNSAANSVRAGEVQPFDTTPVLRLTPECITGTYKVFAAARKGMPAALVREPDADVIAPTEVAVPTEIRIIIRPTIKRHGFLTRRCRGCLSIREVFRCKEYESTDGAVRARC